MIKKIAILFLLGLSIGHLYCQNDTTQTKRETGFGGPNQVEQQLAKDEQTKKSIFDFTFLDPYFEFKTRVKERTGLSFGVDYSAGYFSGNRSVGESSAGSGMVRLFGSWNLVGKKTKNSGAIIYKIEHRHAYTQASLKELGFNLGYVGLIMPPFNNDQFRMTNFYWRQRLAEGRIALVVGFLDVTDYVDVYALASPWMHFTNFAFSTGSQTMFVPNDVNLGVAVAGYITDHVYVIAGINDANSDPTRPFYSLESSFELNQYYKSIEVGWVTSQSRHFFDNIHIMYWHSDGSHIQNSPEGWGLNFSGSWFVQDKWMPFIRGGYAEDGGSLLQKSVVAGVGFQAVPDRDLLGFALGWGQVNETTWAPGLPDQYTMELFYRMQFSKRMAITPSLQYLIDPALNMSASSIFLWGVRGRISL